MTPFCADENRSVLILTHAADKRLRIIVQLSKNTTQFRVVFLLK